MGTPLAELERSLRSHDRLCKCGLCAELFWRSLIDRAGLDRERIPDALYVFDVAREHAADALELMRRVDECARALLPLGATITLRVTASDLEAWAKPSR